MVSVDTDMVRIDEVGAVTTVRLNRPEKLNALTPELVEGLRDAFAGVVEEPGRPVLLAGEGRVTCAGMDTDIVGGGNYEEEYGDLDETLGEFYDLVESHTGPVAMAGRGAVVGAAAILSLSCPFLILEPETTFVVPEIRYEITPGRAVDGLVDAAGRRAAAEVALLGEEIDAARAADLGIATEVASDAEIRASEILETIAGYDDETVVRTVERLRIGTESKAVNGGSS